MASVSVEQRGQVLVLTVDSRAIRFHAVWLRDNAWDAETRSEANGQKLIALRDIDKSVSISDASISDQTVSIRFMPEDRVIAYDCDWLVKNAYDYERPEHSGWLRSDIETWDSSLQNHLPVADWKAINTSKSDLCAWLGKTARYGFGKITGAPIEENSLFKVVDLFGYVRETNYGRHFEVRTEINPTNLAFTSLGLQAHTDNPYRDPVPTVQILYCLESSAKGGENMVVDGYRAALRLRDENPDWFDVLSNYCARFEYRGEAGVVLRSRKPLIELAPDGELIGVRFNNRSAAAITDVPFDAMATYYAAYRRLGEIIDDPEMEVVFRLEPGECFLVDNTRVLHARKGYSGTGMRWLQGCYADRDGLHSTLAALREALPQAAE